MLTSVPSRLNLQGHPIGLKLLDLLLFRESRSQQTRPLTILSLLHFIEGTLWMHLFGRKANGLQQSSNAETPNEYMVIDNEPVVNAYISVPKEMSQLNCAAFVAGIIEGVCDGAGFATEGVHAISVAEQEGEEKGGLWPGKTVFLIKFKPEVLEREEILGRGGG